MPSVLWVSLPTKWKLTDVQAGLQVVIAVLSCLGIFAFARFCWQLSSHRVKKNRAVALASLMSINTIGEAFDAALLLRQRIFRQRYWKILAQSIVVVILTASTIVSGPIAKASTRLGTIVRIINVPGSLATNVFNSRAYAAVEWNDTSTSLDRAGFPLDQLLDFMPTTSVAWLYKADEWNSTWAMHCDKVENTPVTMVDTGVCTNFSTEFPATDDIFPWNSFDVPRWTWQSLYWNSTWTQDVLAMFTGWNYFDYNSTTDITYNMSITVVALHMHWLNKTGDNDNCQFGAGPVESSSYTKMTCNLTRSHTIPDEDHLAYPDATDYDALGDAYIANWYDQFSTQANTNETISPITPDQLIRFYQTYVITKDLQYPQPVSRQLTADIQVVQLSSTFIAFGTLFAILVLIGLIHHGIFHYRHRGVLHEIPESKLDWIVQSIIDGSHAQVAPQGAQNRRSVVAPLTRTQSTIRDPEKVRAVFESAKYGSETTEEIALTNTGTELTTPSPYSLSVAPGFENVPTHYNPVGHQNAPYHNINPYEASFAAQIQGHGPAVELQNPEGHVYNSNHRGRYSRLT